MSKQGIRVILLWVGILLVSLLALKAIATEKQDSGYCWFDTVSNQVECLSKKQIDTYQTYRSLMRMEGLEKKLNLQNMSPEKREQYTQELLLKAEKNLKLRRNLHHKIALAVLQYDGFQEELSIMGTDKRLIQLEKKVLANGN